MRAPRVRGTWWPLWLGTCPHAKVAADGLPLWRTSSPRIGAPRLVQSGRSRCSSRLSGRRGAFPHPGGCRPRLYWLAARGTWRPAGNPALCACRWPLPRQGRWARSASYPFGAPRWGCLWRVPPAFVLGCLRCGCLRVWTRSLTRPVSRTVRLSTEDSGGAPGVCRVDADTAIFGSEDATPGSRACACVCSSWPGRAGRPPGRVLVRLTFSCGRPLCAFGLFGPVQAGVALLLVVFRGSFFLVLFFPCCAPVVPVVPCFPAWRALGLGLLWSSCPAPLFCFSFLFFPLFPSPRPAPFFFVFFSPLLLFVCLLPFFFVCLGVPVLRCWGWFVCPALWAVLVCVAVGLVPRRGLFCACAVSLIAPWLCVFCVCCCLSCGGVVVCFVFCPVLCGVPVLGLVLSPCCCPLLPLPGPLSWPVVVVSPGVLLRCSGGRLWCGELLSASCLAGGAVLFRSRRLVLCVVACGCWMSVAGSGCLLLFSAGVCCRGCSCLAAWPAALLCAVVCCGAPLPCGVSCVLWCCVAVWCRAVPPCCPFSFPCGVGLCPFPVCVVLWCAARCVVRCRLGLRCCWCLMLWSVAVCCGVSLAALWLGGAAVACRGLLLCRAVVTGAVSPCAAVLLGCAVCCALLRLLLFPLRIIFLFLKIQVK